ncbi:MAG TPA: glycosyltransferase [Chitinophagaceae bacterium]|nr:glycosyltransferase [Chitinophagaceae bacterium]
MGCHEALFFYSPENVYAVFMEMKTAQKKRLLVFHQALAPYRVDLWNSLNELYDLKLYFIYENLLEQKFDQDDLRSKLNFKCYYLKKGFRIRYRSFRWGFLSIIRKFKPDVIFTYEYSQTTMFIHFIKKLFNYKFSIYSICDDSLLLAKNCKGPRKMSRNYLVEKLDGLITVNKEVADWYNREFSMKNKCVVFPIIANESVFRARLNATLSKANLLLTNYKLAGKKCILYVGRLAEFKGIDRLIKSFAGITRDNPDALLILVGSGPEFETLKKLTVELGVQDMVLFAGRHEGLDLLAWYNIGQVFVLASHQENFGAVVNEALLSGMNVLCSRNAGAHELVTPGINGNTFDPYDLDTLSALLKDELQKVNNLEQIAAMRPSKMQYSYGECIENFSEKLNSCVL